MFIQYSVLLKIIIICLFIYFFLAKDWPDELSGPNVCTCLIRCSLHSIYSSNTLRCCVHSNDGKIENIHDNFYFRLRRTRYRLSEYLNYGYAERTKMYYTDFNNIQYVFGVHFLCKSYMRISWCYEGWISIVSTYTITYYDLRYENIVPRKKPDVCSVKRLDCNQQVNNSRPIVYYSHRRETGRAWNIGSIGPGLLRSQAFSLRTSLFSWLVYFEYGAFELFVWTHSLTPSYCRR
jgi:hypothetical protein